MSTEVAFDAQRTRLDVSGLTLAIGGNPVLRGVDLRLTAGRITALVGPNGAGKSSIIKCISGYYRDVSATSFTIDGNPLAVPCDPRSVRNAGLRVVHQDLGLVNDLSTFDNVALSAIDLAGLRRVPRKEWHASVTDAIKSLGGDFDIHRPVRELRPHERVLAAVARASHSVAGSAPMSVLVLDEVTAALPADEVEIVLDRMRRISRTNVAVLFVTHHFDEVLDVADTVVVAREGRLVASRPTAGMTTRDVTDLVFFGDTDTSTSRPAGEGATHSATVATGPTPGLSAVGLSGIRVRDVDIRFDGGSIVGITGRVGSGKSELGRLLAGLQPATAGNVIVGSTPITAVPRARLGEIIGYVPQDRESQGVIADMTLSENLHLGASFLAGSGARRTRLWNARSIRSRDKAVLTANLVRPPNPDVLMKTLSGGNQQKVMFLRALAVEPEIVIVDEPTIGVDVLSRTHLHAMLRARADAGAAVLIISSEAEEVLTVADSIFIMMDGRLGEPIDPNRITLNELEGLIASGGVDKGRTQ